MTSLCTALTWPSRPLSCALRWSVAMASGEWSTAVIDTAMGVGGGRDDCCWAVARWCWYAWAMLRANPPVYEKRSRPLHCLTADHCVWCLCETSRQLLLCSPLMRSNRRENRSRTISLLSLMSMNHPVFWPRHGDTSYRSPPSHIHTGDPSLAPLGPWLAAGVWSPLLGCQPSTLSWPMLRRHHTAGRLPSWWASVSPRERGRDSWERSAWCISGRHISVHSADGLTTTWRA
mmetsp:Transcript_6320/g.18186  ORF Transcript_6320/g.18186 Transcript_6320/m.18186 type:complete len:232 (-) Transcript_6320:384-1079(-)